MGGLIIAVLPRWQRLFERTVATVREPGEFAVRGGILDLFAPGREEPCGSISSATRWNRSVRSIPLTQRTTWAASCWSCSEAGQRSDRSTPRDGQTRFRHGYVERVRRADGDVALYEAVERRTAVRGDGALAAAVPRRDWRRCSTGSAGRPRLCVGPSRWRRCHRGASSRSRSTIEARQGRKSPAQTIGWRNALQAILPPADLYLDARAWRGSGTAGRTLLWRD